MKNAIVELSIWTTKGLDPEVIHEMRVNGVYVMLTKAEYEAIEKTL